MKKIFNIIVAFLPVTWMSICIISVYFNIRAPDYWYSFVEIFIVALLVLAPAAGIWYVLKWITKSTIGSTAAANDAGPGASASASRRKRPSLLELRPLLKSFAFARQQDGGAIVFLYMLMWRGYRLTPEQAQSYLASWGEGAEGGWMMHRAASVLLQVTGSAACLSLLWLTIRPDRWSFLSLVVTTAATVGSILLLRAQTKRSFENQFPTATERQPDPNRIRKRVFLLMLTPLWGHLGSGLLAPLLLWLTVMGVTDVATSLSQGTFDVAMAKKELPGIVVIAALTAAAVYIASQHIAFRIRHGRGPNVDDFHAL